MKTDLEYLYCILSLLDKNPKNHVNLYHKTTIQIDSVLEFEDFFEDWISKYLHSSDKFNFHFTVYCYFYYLNNKSLFKDGNDYITPMTDYTHTILVNFKKLNFKENLNREYGILNYIKMDIISKTKYYIRRIQLKELINEN